MKLILLLSILFCFIFFGCAQESALSDVDDIDPSLITLEISIDKEIGKSSVYYRNEIWLLDKNRNAIDLKNGEIKINNKKLAPTRTLFNEPYYMITAASLPFAINSFYEAEVIFKNGDSYKSSIVTRTKDLTSLNVPENHNKSQDLTVTWSDITTDHLASIFINVHANDSTIGSKETLNISNPSSGSFTIPKSFFQAPGFYKIDVTLNVEQKGIINKSFRSGSKISSKISITKTANLN